MTARQRRVVLYFARRYFNWSPAEWDALPPELQHLCLTQPIGDDD
ncbi:MAG TPA: hypothetical protein VK599_09140 [Streptosporangiaceae bacterium]|nr:hypothetical protein [Streptosporangiaceae bacterium]